jgi:hypothetical protein
MNEVTGEAMIGAEGKKASSGRERVDRLAGRKEEEQTMSGREQTVTSGR